MNEYLVILERGPDGWGAWSPDLGVYATASSREEVERLVREAIEFHLEGLREDGDAIPEPSTSSMTVTA
jgi:predicted RNase H-like HicB family nuclease